MRRRRHYLSGGIQPVQPDEDVDPDVLIAEEVERTWRTRYREIEPKEEESDGSPES